jgi:hypothetical protein
MQARALARSELGTDEARENVTEKSSAPEALCRLKLNTVYFFGKRSKNYLVMW